MTSRFSRKAQKGGPLGRRRPLTLSDRRAPAEPQQKGPRMSLTRKLLLSAELVGLEAAMNFQQIYNIPALQIMGMPLSLVYIQGLVSGPTSILILPFLGWFIDMGSNPQGRRFASIVLAALLQSVGIMCMLVGNFMHIRGLVDHNDTLSAQDGLPTDSTTTVFPVSLDGLSGEMGQNLSRLIEDPSVSNSSDFFGHTETAALVLAANSTADMSSSESFTVPVKAGLGLLGFILMDLGFDCSNCFVKAFMVSCSPRAEQTSLLVLGVVMGALGGVINAGLGLVDFTAMLGLSSSEGTQLIIQISVQSLCVLFIVIVGLMSTFITGRIQLRQLHQYQSQAREDGRSSQNIAPRSEYDATKRSLAETFENSIRSLEGSIIFMETSVSLVEDKKHLRFSEDAPLLGDDTLLEQEGVEEEGEEEENEGGEEDEEPSVTLSVGYGAIEKPPTQTIEKASDSAPADCGEGSASQETGPERGLSWLHSPKVRIFFVCLTTFFTTNMVALFTNSVSDFVGKGIYDGDPNADPGSESLSRYQAGVQMASRALLVYFITYFFSSMLHSKVLALLGFRAEFLLLQTVFIVTMILTAWTRRLEAIFVLAVVTGTHRTCFFTMPYAVTNDLAQTIVIKDSSRSPVGLALSLVSACIPMSYCLLFSWVGAAQDLTGDVSIPLWLGSGAGLLGIISFLFVGKV